MCAAEILSRPCLSRVTRDAFTRDRRLLYFRFAPKATGGRQNSICRECHNRTSAPDYFSAPDALGADDLGKPLAA